MKTNIHPALANRSDVRDADDILRRCVHCGFCTATCPTYQITGDELDGPRGRIYLIKNLLEENRMQADTAQHLDRCLTCRACETTCPSGVEYGRLLEVGREIAAEKSKRPLLQRGMTALLRFVIPKRILFVPLLRLGQLLRPVMPGFIKHKVPPKQTAFVSVQNGTTNIDLPESAPRVLLLTGCVQSAATPNTTAALTKILHGQGIQAEQVVEGCCGSLDLHLAARDKAEQRMKRVVDLLYPRLGSCVGIVSTATGCEVTLRDYPELLKHDPEYQARAVAILAKVRDPADFVKSLRCTTNNCRVAVHVPCSMQHGMKQGQGLEQTMQALGYNVVHSKDKHLCCGSAGTYSILQPAMANELRANKLVALNVDTPDVIVTANVGCQLHLADETPVMHWLELVAMDCEVMD